MTGKKLKTARESMQGWEETQHNLDEMLERIKPYITKDNHVVEPQGVWQSMNETSTMVSQFEN